MNNITLINKELLWKEMNNYEYFNFEIILHVR